MAVVAYRTFQALWELDYEYKYFSEIDIAVPNMEYRPNPQPLPFNRRGVRFKPSLLLSKSVQ